MNRITKWVDIKDMPSFNPEVKNGIASISEGKIYLAITKYYPTNEVLPYCVEHGALNRVSANIWRCTQCNEGCYIEGE